MRSVKEIKFKGRFISNGYFLSLYEKFFLYFGWYDYSILNYEVYYRYSSYIYDRGKYVWLCRDDEIYKFIV